MTNPQIGLKIPLMGDETMTDQTITLKDMDDWAEFAATNREALVDAYDSTAKAYQHAVQGGLILGGGAPLYHIVFAE